MMVSSQKKPLYARQTVRPALPEPACRRERHRRHALTAGAASARDRRSWPERASAVDDASHGMPCCFERPCEGARAGAVRGWPACPILVAGRPAPGLSKDLLPHAASDQCSPSRGSSPTRLHGRVRASSCARSSFSHAVLHADVEPGKAKIKVWLDSPANARDCRLDVPISPKLTARNSSPKPGISLSSSGSTASGVESRPVKPVPPV